MDRNFLSKPHHDASPSGNLYRSSLLILGIPVLVSLVHAGISLALGADPVHDDVFIFIRYAQNWVNGHGLVFNIGERVEGFTSPAWTLLTAFFIRLGLPALESLQMAGLLAFAASAAATARLARFLRASPTL